MDERLLLWINQCWGHPLLDSLFWWVSQRLWFAYPLAAMLLYESIRQHGRDGVRWFLLLMATVAAGDILGNLLKAGFAAPRPCQVLFEQLRALGGAVAVRCGTALNGMPSNHAINFFAAATFIALTLPGRKWKVGLFAVAVLVGLSRIYLGKHYPSQVLVGALLGVGVGGFGAWLALRYRHFLWTWPLAQTIAESSTLKPLDICMNLTPPNAALPPHRLSLVVPLYDEQDNVFPLLAGIHEALANYPYPWELIAVDDGSDDGTAERLADAAHRYGLHVRVLTLQRNFGQTAAMQAGIDAARGEVIATLDGDLQNDPADIPRMVGRLLHENLDLVVGWRQNRQDNLWLRTIPSRIANRLIGDITGVRVHDYGCSLKVYRAAVIKRVRLYGEMHRFIPAWMSLQTAPRRIQEEVVNHRARQYGESKYGLGRTFRVMVDLLSVYFFLRFLTRPGHFFGRIGLVSAGAGLLILLYLLAQKLLLGAHIGTRPLLLVGVLLVLMAVQFLTTGVMSELITRTYFASSTTLSYALRPDPVATLTADEGWWKPQD